MSSINIPHPSVTVNPSELSKSEIYKLFAELSVWLNLNRDEHNQHINADGVIEEVRKAHDMGNIDNDIAISSFLELDENIQRSIATDALNDAISLYSGVQPSLDHIDDLDENEIDLASEDKIYDIHTAAANDVIRAFR